MKTTAHARKAPVIAWILIGSAIVQAAPPIVPKGSSPDAVSEGTKSKPIDSSLSLGEMVTIPAGSFQMGNNGSEGFGGPEEFPQHWVNLPTYQIGNPLRFGLRVLSTGRGF